MLNRASRGDLTARNLGASSLKTDRMNTRYFRALPSAAPLKLDGLLHQAARNRDFRALTSAAPLKHHSRKVIDIPTSISALSRARPN